MRLFPKALFVHFLLLIAGVAVAQTLPSNPLQDKMISETPERPGGPIHFFSFDGTIVDDITGVVPSIANGYSHTDGYIGEAVLLDGTGMIELPVDLASEAQSDFTIIAMVKPNALPEDSDERATYYNTGYVFSDASGLVTIGNQSKDNAYFAAYSSGTIISNSNHPALRGGWQMLAFTRKIDDRTTDDGELLPHTILTLYSNGRISESVAVYRNDGVAPILRLGSKAFGSSQKFHGAFDHLSIYNRALSQDELREVNDFMRQARSGGLKPFANSALNRSPPTARDDAPAPEADSSISDTQDKADRLGNFKPNDKTDKLGNFDQDEAKFPGDQFDPDAVRFPGDMFDGDENDDASELQFPGDMFDGAPQSENQPNSESSANTASLPGERKPPNTSPQAGVELDGTRAADNNANRSPPTVVQAGGIPQLSEDTVSSDPTIDERLSEFEENVMSDDWAISIPTDRIVRRYYTNERPAITFEVAKSGAGPITKDVGVLLEIEGGESELETIYQSELATAATNMQEHVTTDIQLPYVTLPFESPSKTIRYSLTLVDPITRAPWVDSNLDNNSVSEQSRAVPVDWRILSVQPYDPNGLIYPGDSMGFDFVIEKNDVSNVISELLLAAHSIPSDGIDATEWAPATRVRLRTENTRLASTPGTLRIAFSKDIEFADGALQKDVTINFKLLSPTANDPWGSPLSDGNNENNTKSVLVRVTRPEVTLQ